MRLLRQIVPGFLIALVALVIVLGGFSLSFAEGGASTPPPVMSDTPLPSDTPILHTSTPVSVTETLQPVTATLTAISSPTPTPTLCPYPAGWSGSTVQAGDTLEALAAHSHISVELLKQANCLTGDSLQAGSTIHLPPAPTRTAITCGAPTGWRAYTVQPGDNLYRLSQAYGITVSQLQNANCMGGSTLIRVGQTLFVPSWATRTPTPTTWWPVIPSDTFTPWPTDTDYPTLPPEPATETPTPVP